MKYSKNISNVIYKEYKLVVPPAFQLSEAQFEFVKNLELNKSLPLDKSYAYVSQCLTDDPSRPIWLDDYLKRCNAYYLIDPSEIQYQYVNLSTELIVKNDIFLCYLSDFILLDLTKGNSVGASVECTLSKIMNKPIYGIKYKHQTTSRFTQFLCYRILNYEDQDFIPVK